MARIVSVADAASVRVLPLYSRNNPNTTSAHSSRVLHADDGARELEFETRVEAEVSRRLAALPPKVSGVAQLRSALLRDELLALGKVLAERLIGQKLALEPQTIALIAAEVLSEARGARRIQLSVSAVDHAALVSAVPRLSEWFSTGIDVAVDSTLGTGDLRISSELGQSDARINTRLDCLLELLR